MCAQCANNVYIVSDTNLFVFLMNFISFKNHSISIDDFCSRLERFLDLLCNCSLNKSINMTQRLYDDELNFNSNRNCTLSRRAHYFKNSNLSGKNRILSIIESHTTIHTVKNLDVSNLETKSSNFFHSYPPGENDISLLILCMKLSNLNNNTSILITEDTKLRRVLEEILYEDTYFTKDDGMVWEVENTFAQNIIDPLSRIFSCCKFNDIDEMYKFYVDYFLLNRLKHLSFFTQKFKTRMIINSSAHLEKCKYQKEQNKIDGICA